MENIRLKNYIFNIYRCVSGVNSSQDKDAFGGQATIGDVRKKVDAFIDESDDNAYLAQIAVEQVQRELVIGGLPNVDLGDEGFNVYNMKPSVRYALYKAFTTTDIYPLIGSMVTKTVKVKKEGKATKEKVSNFVSFKLDNPDAVNKVASWVRLGIPENDHVSANSTLSAVFMPGGEDKNNNGWDGHLYKNEWVSGVKINDLGVAVRPIGSLYVAVTVDYKSISYSKSGNGSLNEKDPQDLGTDNELAVKYQFAFLNPIGLAFHDKSRHIGLTITHYSINDTRGDAVTIFNHGNIGKGNRMNVFFPLTNGAGGAVGFGLGSYNFYGNYQDLPGDTGWFAYNRYGGGYDILYSGTLGAVDLGIKISDEVGNGNYATVAGVFDWEGKNPLLTTQPDLGSGQGDATQQAGDWNRYVEQDRSGELSIGFNRLLVKALNAHPVLSFKVASSSQRGREHSDLYTIGGELGGIKLSLSRAVNAIPRDDVGKPNLDTNFWNMEIPLDVAYWVSRKNGEPDPKISAGLVLNMGGYTQFDPCEGMSSNSGTYFNIAFKFAPGTSNKKKVDELKVTEGPRSQLINEAIPAISELKTRYDAKKDAKRLEDRERPEPGWTNRGQRIEIKKETSGDAGETK